MGSNFKDKTQYNVSFSDYHETENNYYIISYGQITVLNLNKKFKFLLNSRRTFWSKQLKYRPVPGIVFLTTVKTIVKVCQLMIFHAEYLYFKLHVFNILVSCKLQKCSGQQRSLTLLEKQFQRRSRIPERRSCTGMNAFLDF